ncbi:MAG: RHS repeat domain-containing protein [Kiritimatiellia bacterium]
MLDDKKTYARIGVIPRVWALAAVFMNLTVDPPEVVSEWPCVSDCQRDASGVSFALDDTSCDLDFSFIGLPEEASVSYVLLAGGAVVEVGDGTRLPLSSFPDADAVRFLSADASVDWGAVTSVRARVAARPMVMQRTGNWNLFYTHDMRPRRRRRVARGSVATEPRSGRKRPRNKNVSELVYYQRARGVAAHYEYAPFGAVTVQTRGDGWGTLDFSSLNPFRFSSEFADDALGLVYYNYRHYDPLTGRWLSRDSSGEHWSRGLCSFLSNNCRNYVDVLGLCCCGDCQVKDFKYLGSMIIGFRLISAAGKDFATISLEKALEGMKGLALEEFVKSHGDDLMKSIFAARKSALGQMSFWESIANFSVSTGFVLKPQLQIAKVMNYQRRDCTKRWWSFLFVGRCTWSSWENRHVVMQPEWRSPPASYDIESMFDVAGVVRNPKEVLEKIIEGLRSIVESREADGFDEENYKSGLGCELMEDTGEDS